MFKMDCGNYYNGWKFTVGTKYLTVEQMATGEKDRVELTEHVKSELTRIKEATEWNDADRTWQVLRLLDTEKTSPSDDGLKQNKI